MNPPSRPPSKGTDPGNVGQPAQRSPGTDTQETEISQAPPQVPRTSSPTSQSQPAEQYPSDLYAPESSTSQMGTTAGSLPFTSSYSSSSQDSAYGTPPAIRYQLVTSGSTSNPRAMSQVSPGFIFVIFLSLRDCSFLLGISFKYTGQSVLAIAQLSFHVSCLLSSRLVIRTLSL